MDYLQIVHWFILTLQNICMYICIGYRANGFSGIDQVIWEILKKALCWKVFLIFFLFFISLYVCSVHCSLYSPTHIVHRTHYIRCFNVFSTVSFITFDLDFVDAIIIFFSFSFPKIAIDLRKKAINEKL